MILNFCLIVFIVLGCLPSRSWFYFLLSCLVYCILGFSLIWENLGFIQEGVASLFFMVAFIIILKSKLDMNCWFTVWYCILFIIIILLVGIQKYIITFSSTFRRKSISRSRSLYSRTVLWLSSRRSVVVVYRSLSVELHILLSFYNVYV